MLNPLKLTLTFGVDPASKTARLLFVGPRRCHRSPDCACDACRVERQISARDGYYFLRSIAQLDENDLQTGTVVLDGTAWFLDEDIDDYLTNFDVTSMRWFDELYGS